MFYKDSCFFEIIGDNRDPERVMVPFITYPPPWSILIIGRVRLGRTWYSLNQASKIDRLTASPLDLNISRSSQRGCSEGYVILKLAEGASRGNNA